MLATLACGVALSGCGAPPRAPASTPPGVAAAVLPRAVAATPGQGLPTTPPAPGYELLERGAMVVRGGVLARREEFDVWLAPDGARWLRSIVSAADGSYRVAGEWRSDATGARHAVTGRGAIDGEPLELAIDARPGNARVEIRRGARPPEVLDGNCSPECLVDLSPSAVAMFAMTRDPRLRVGEPREFRWIGHALQADSVLLDGVARLVRLQESEVTRPDGSRLRVRHDAFQETVTDLRTGFTARVFFNLWTDDAGRPLKFASTRAVGLREGYEDLASLAPATLEQVFPASPSR